MNKIKVGIIGGKGKMGTWFRSFFERDGYEVITSDINTQATNEDIVKKSDVVLFSVPINIAPELMESLAGHSKEGQLWMDVTSIKTPAVRAMLKSRAEVLGMHPMFSHNTGMKGQTIVLCRARLSEWAGWMEGLIEKNKGIIKFSTPEKHDRAMAVIQGLTHFSLISLGYALKEMNVDMKEALEYASPVYRLRLGMVGRILSQDPEMYADIEIENEETQVAVRKYIESMMKLYLSVKDHEREDFISYFREASLFLGDFKERAMKESQDIIEKNN